MPPRPDLVRVCGARAVAALFARSPARVERLFFLAGLRVAMADYCAALAARRKPFRVVEADELTRVAGTAMHGGVVAVALPKPIAEFNPVAASRETSAHRLLVVLDGVSNPQNLGAIARTLAFFGGDRLILSDHPAQAGLSDAAHRVAEGGMEHIEVFRARGIAAALAKLKPAYRVVGTALGQGVPLEQVPRDKPIALVLGNEEHGAPAATLAACDSVITLPGSGQVQSLNVSATAAILIHALR